MNNLDIKKIREELLLTQQQFADALSVDIRTVQKWESNSTKISLNNISKIKALKERPDRRVLKEGSEEYKQVEKHALDVVENWESYMQITAFKLKVKTIAQANAIEILSKKSVTF